jgi:hypothetical protein
MISPKELTKWLKTIPQDATLGIDDGGLILCAEDENGEQLGYCEIGGTLSENMEEE